MQSIAGRRDYPPQHRGKKKKKKRSRACQNVCNCLPIVRSNRGHTGPKKKGASTVEDVPSSQWAGPQENYPGEERAPFIRFPAADMQRLTSRPRRGLVPHRVQPCLRGREGEGKKGGGGASSRLIMYDPRSDSRIRPSASCRSDKG